METHFEEAQIVFWDLANTGQLPVTVHQKLSLLQQAILSQPQGVYDQVDKEDRERLLHLKPEVQKQMFCQILSNFAVNVPCGYQNQIEGDIDVQTKTLKNWKPKKFNIDINNETFEILRSNKPGKKSKKKQRLINLKYYYVEYKEFKEKRYRFGLYAKDYTAERDGYYKNIICGSKDQAMYNRITDALKNIVKLKSAKQSHNSQSVIGYPLENGRKQERISATEIQVKPPSPKVVVVQQSIPIQEIKQIESPKPKPVEPILIQQSPVKEQHFPLLIQQLVDDGKLKDDYFDQNISLFQQVASKDGVTIYAKNGLCFRTTFTISKTDIQRVFQSLAEIEFMKKWNAVISHESRFVSMIGGDKSGIIYQKHKQYGMLYLPRDYVYLRFVYKRGESYLIIDRSIIHDEVAGQFKVIRGEINYQIIEITPRDGQVSVKIESEITNGGLSSQAQDSAITQWYLAEYKNLAAFLKTYNQQEIIQTPLLSAITTQEQMIEQPFEKLRTLTQVAFQPEIANEVDQNVDEISQFEQVDEFFDVDPDVYIPAPIQQLPVVQYVKQEVEVKNIQVNHQIQESSQVIKLEDLLVLNTLPNLTQQELEKVKKLIPIVEQEKYFQFCIKNIYQLEPMNMSEQLIEQIDGGQYFIRQDWKRDLKNGGLMFINETKVEAQKRVIKFMLKSIGSNLLSGKSILSISLPVEIFEIRSNVERFAYSFGFAPRYLEQGAKAQTAEEQMKSTLTFGMTSIIMYLSLEKPFNPILGETYQGIINGCTVYCEQISHHPPVCAFQLKGRGYSIDGHIESAASMHANSVTGKNIGYIRVTYYNTGAQQLFIQCPGSLSGTAFGQRMFNLSGKQFGIDIKNLIIGDLTFNPKVSMFGRKEFLQDQYVGAIYKVKETAVIRYQKEGYVKYSGLDIKQDVVQKLFDVSGVWNEHMIVDGQEVFNMSMLPHRMMGDPNPIPSDSNYRLDILHWKLRDFDNAQRTKELLEIRQRNDRKQREKLHGKKH